MMMKVKRMLITPDGKVTEWEALSQKERDSFVKKVSKELIPQAYEQVIKDLEQGETITVLPKGKGKV